MTTNTWGEFFVTGFEGKEISADDQAFLDQAGIAGVWFRENNFESPAQLIETVRGLQENRRIFHWTLVEHEGGKHQTWKSPFSNLPSLQRMGELDSPQLTFEVSEVASEELEAVGMNVQLGPIAEVRPQGHLPAFISERTFSTEEDTVGKLVSAWTRGSLAHRVQPCVRFYHGQTKTTFQKAFRAKCQWTQLSAPACLDSQLITDLRAERFLGVILTDDLCSPRWPEDLSIEQRALRSLEAGCDLILCSKTDATRKALTAVHHQIESGAFTHLRIGERKARLTDLRRRMLSHYQIPDDTQIRQHIGTEKVEPYFKKQCDL